MTSTPGRRADRPAAPEQDAARRALVARRAAAAKRRLIVTLTLLGAMTLAWVGAGFHVVPAGVGVVVTGLLVAVLALGRNAAAAAARSDAAWRASQTAQAERVASSRVLGAPAPLRNRGHVAATQAISLSELEKLAGPKGTRVEAGDSAAPAAQVAAAIADEEPEPAPVAEPVSGQTPAHDADAAAATAAARAAVEADLRRASEAAARIAAKSEQAAREKAAREKAAREKAAREAAARAEASRAAVEPAAVSGPLAEVVPIGTGWSSQSWTRTAPEVGETSWSLRSGEVPQADAPVPPAITGEAVDGILAENDDAAPSTDSLGLPLNDILARRRAV